MQKIDLTSIDIPVMYIEYTDEERIDFCNQIVDKLLLYVDRELTYLPVNLSRKDFLEGILESSLIVNESYENWEVCCVIRDCKKILNESNN